MNNQNDGIEAEISFRSRSSESKNNGDNGCCRASCCNNSTVNSIDETIVCAICGKPICKSEKTIGLLAMHFKLKKHQRIVSKINGV